jgi:hypothetical protein
MQPQTRPPYTVSAQLLAREDFHEACAARDFARIFKLMSKYDGASQDRMCSPVDGLTQSRISKIMRGSDHIAHLDLMLRIADALRIPGHLLGFTPRPWEDTEPTSDAARPHSVNRSQAGGVAVMTETAPTVVQAPAGEVVDRLLNVEIVVDPEGRVTLHYEHELQNLTQTAVTRISRQFWFKHTDGPLIVQAEPGGDRNVLIQRVHDVGVHMKFACQIFPAIGPGETAKFGYSCSGGMFSDELYWRQSVMRPTQELHLRLRLQGVEALTGCSAVEERPDGSELTATESLTWSREKDGIVIDLTRRDLRTNQSVTLRWDVARASA